MSALDRSPPYTKEFHQALEQWDEIHKENMRLQGEFNDMAADNAVMRQKIEWLEGELLQKTVIADRYKSANIEITTALNNIASLFTTTIERVRDDEFAPPATLIPNSLKGEITEEEMGRIKGIAQRFSPRAT